MPLPDVIPIAHEPDYRTDSIGTYDGGQFFTSFTGAYRDGDEHRSELTRQYARLPREGRRRQLLTAGVRSAA